MSLPALRTGIPILCPACSTRSLSIVADVAQCECGWRREVRDGLLDLSAELSQNEQTQRETYDQQQLGALQTSDPFRSFVSPAGLRLTRMLRRLHLGEGDCFLEVACAAGPLLDAIASNFGARGLGIDISPASVRQQMLRRGDRAHFDAVVAPADSLPLPDETVNAVTAFDIVEHLEHPERLYMEAARVLKPGGTLLVRCPVTDFGLSLDWWQNLLTPRRWKQRMREAGHFYENFRSKKQHRAMARAAGLRVVYSTGYDVFWDNFIEYMLMPMLAHLRPRQESTGQDGPATSTNGIELRVPNSKMHKGLRAWARIADLCLLPERVLGRLGFGASMWLLAEKPATSADRPRASGP
ncbi:MAG: class I SAM-dependent methyltransferase [Planctomycetes bacterium]|nr:class I SAM-dependent methyltransferase [Planctomycetota bacterium]